MSEPIRLGLRFDHGFAQARAFLAALGGDDAPFTFQTFPDRGRGDPPVRDDRARITTGVFDEQYKALARLNDRRAGVFVTVNPQRGPGRSDTNTSHPRAIWHENDGALADNVSHVWPLPPSMIVRTRENHTHLYWLLEHTEGTVENWSVWEGVERHLIEKRGSDPNCLKRCQVLRVPDYFHAKDATNPHLVQLAQPFNGRRYTLDQMAQAFPPIERQRAVPPPTTLEIDQHGIRDLPSVAEADWRDIIDALRHINPDASAVPTGEGDGTRSRWLRCLMALEETKHPDRRTIAEEWSRCGGLDDQRYPVSAKLVQHAHYVEGEIEFQMSSFRRADGNKIGIGSLIRYAKEGGWPGWKHSDKGDPMQGLVDTTPERKNVTTEFVHTSGDEALCYVVPKQDFLLDQFLSGDGTFSAIAGRGGIGKSKLVLGIAAAIAAGTAAFGYGPLGPPIAGSTIIVDLENNRNEFARRLQDHVRAMVLHNQISPDDSIEIMSRVRHIHVDRMLFPLAFSSAGSPMRHNTHWVALYDELCKARDACEDGPRWCVLDALYKFHALNENDNMHMIFVLEQINDLIDRVFGKIPRSVVHHSKKGSSGDYFADASGGLRGAGAVEAAMRSVVALRGLDDSECKIMGISQDQRREFAVVQVQKSNYQVMKPDNFMVRSFGGTWWYCGREPVSDGEATQAIDEKFHKFLVRLYELLILKKVSATLYKLQNTYRYHFDNVDRPQLQEWVGRAVAAGYVRMLPGSRGQDWVQWVDAPAHLIDNDLGI